MRATKTRVAAALFEQVLRHGVARAVIVDADQIEPGAIRETLIAAIQQHNGDLFAGEQLHDAAIGRFAVRPILQRSEEDAGDLLVDELPAELLGNRAQAVAFALRGGVPPKQDVGLRQGRLHDALADGLKDLRAA